jgi:hypothetical protein
VNQLTRHFARIAAASAALAGSAGACVSATPLQRTCYRAIVTAESFHGSVLFASSIVNAAGDVALDNVTGAGSFPPMLPTSFTFAETSKSVELNVTFHAIPDPDPNGEREAFFTIALRQLPAVGSYSLPALGVCMKGCPFDAPFAGAGGCYVQPSICGAAALCDGGADASAGDAGGRGLVCTPVSGTLSVTTNSTSQCRSDNTVGQGVRGGQVCQSDFQATLTITSTDGAAAHLSGTFDIRLRSDLQAYACSATD